MCLDSIKNSPIPSTGIEGPGNLQSTGVDAQNGLQDSGPSLSGVETLLSQPPEDSPRIEGAELGKINAQSDELKANPVIAKELGLGSQPAVKDAPALPKPLQRLLETGQSLQEQLTGGKLALEDRVRLLPELEATLKALTQELAAVHNPDSAPVMDAKVLEQTSGLDPLADSLQAAQKIQDQIQALSELSGSLEAEASRLSKKNTLVAMSRSLGTDSPLKAYGELLEDIERQPELTEQDRLALRESVIGHCRQAVQAQIATGGAFKTLVENGQLDPASQEALLQAATSLMARVAVANPHRTEPITLEDLYFNFRDSHPGQADPELSQRFCQSLKALADASNPATHTPARDFCRLVDGFSGYGLAHYAVMGGLLKDALAATPETRTYAQLQHTFRVAVKTLLDQIPESKRTGLAITDTLTPELVSALKGLPNFGDLRNEIVHLAILQSEMILAGEVDLQAVTGKPEYSPESLAGLDETSLQAAREKAASELVARFADADPQLGEFIGKSLEILRLPNGEIPPERLEMANALLQEAQHSLKSMSDDYVSRSIRGDKDEQSIAKTLKSVSKSLTGTYFSGNYLQKIYDSDPESKALRIIDGLVQELTGEQDPDKRAILQPDGSQQERISRLMDGARTSILRAISLDSVKNLKEGPSLSAKNTLKELLFDRSQFGLHITGSGSPSESEFDGLVEKLTDPQLFQSIRGTRQRIAKSLRHEQDFALQNGEAIRLHSEKKALDKVYKTQMGIAETVHTVLWKRGKRDKNVGRILTLGQIVRTIASLNAQVQSLTDSSSILAVNTQIGELEKEASRIFQEVRHLNLANFTSQDSQQKLSMDDFLEQALPVAEALDYVHISGQAKIDAAKIEELKEKRDAARKQLDGYLKEAKKSYGGEVIRQIERTVVLAAYLTSVEQGGAARTDEQRNAAVTEFLKQNMPELMRDCDKGLVKLLIADTLRRFTPASGTMNGKYLDKIEKYLGMGHSDSLARKEGLGQTSSQNLKIYKQKAQKMYLTTGTEGLLKRIAKPGQSIIYSKDTSLTVSSLPALIQGSLTVMPSKSICVSNTGSGYKVTIKSELAGRIAASIGVRLKAPTDNLGVIALDASASGTVSHSGGLELAFASHKEVSAFLKDFMNQDSPMHRGERYNPSWHTSTGIESVNSWAVSGSVGVSGKAAIRFFTGKTYTNQTQVLSDPSQNYSVSVKLPTASIGVDLSGSHTKLTKTDRETTTTTTSSHAQLHVGAKFTPLKLTAWCQPVWDGAFDLLGKITPDKVKSALIEPLGKAFEKAVETVSLSPEQAKQLETDMAKLEDHFGRGELDAGFEALGTVLDRMEGPLLASFIKVDPQGSGAVMAVQGLAKALLVENKANHLGIKTMEGFNVKAGVNLKAGPLSMLGQFWSNYSANKTSGLQTAKSPKGPSSNLDKALGYGSKFTGAVFNATMGDIGLATSALSSIPLELLGLENGEIKEELSGKKGQIRATLGGGELASVSGETRSGHVQSSASLSVTSGASVDLTVSFTGTCDTDHITAYNNVSHQYKSSTGINYKLQKGNFGLDNLLEVMHLPEAVGTELASDPVLMKALLTTYSKASPIDTITLRTRIKPAVLARINELELDKSQRPGHEKEIQKAISALLDDSSNYVPVGFDISHSQKSDLRLKYELSSLNLGVFAFSHQRSFGTTTVSSVSLEGLGSVQKELAAA